MELLLDNGYDNLGKAACKHASKEELVPQPGAAPRSSQECESQVSRRGLGVSAVVGVVGVFGWQGTTGTLSPGLWNRNKTYINLSLRFHQTTPDHRNRSIKM